MTPSLSDVRILAIEQYGAGPFGTLQLADLGAEVTKIEDPSVGGDVGRHIPPYQEGEHSLFFESFNRNKRSLALDLRNPAARPLFDRLVMRSDAVVSNLRGDLPEKLRIRYDHLKALNPAVVCVSLSGFGTRGPRKSTGAYDYTIQGLAGWQDLTGEPDGPPTKSGLPLVDLASGYAVAVAVLAGMHAARRDGTGRDYDISLFDVARALLTYIGTWVASGDYAPERRSNSAHQSIVPFQNFRASDGWLVVACPKEHLWQRFCLAIDRSDLLEDARFASFANRNQNREALLAVLESVLATKAVSDWCSILEEAGVPAAPINTVSDALAESQSPDRPAFTETVHPVLGRVCHLRSPFDDAVEAQRAPFLGEHHSDILRELGVSREEELRLRDAGAFGARIGSSVV